MMEIVYLTPKSLFPTSLPSDTIFGAICVGLKEIYGVDELTEILGLFNDGTIPFILSSAFPFVGDSKDNHHFFPKPIVEPFEENITDYLDHAKKFKKARYVHQSIFNDWINGCTSELDIIKAFDENYKVDSTLLIPQKMDLNFRLIVADTPHNVLNRLSNKSENFYYSTGAYYRNAGLFFLIQFLDESYRSKIMAALRFIEDRGFGGDISSGRGQFELNFVESTELIKEPEEADAYTTLSLYSPGNEFNSFDKNRIWYELTKIQGRSSDGRMKKSLFMFKEGSTFPLLDLEFYGGVKEVRPAPKRVVEYGLAFPVKMKEGAWSS
ncbi:CRISPR-associated protein Csm4 [Candidatus Methanophagaceae archaeon]|nr:CRISPR-associated protein Csm4 [Methanophagales archaeon]